MYETLNSHIQQMLLYPLEQNCMVLCTENVSCVAKGNNLNKFYKFISKMHINKVQGMLSQKSS